jgi:hypothetical protein
LALFTFNGMLENRVLGIQPVFPPLNKGV